MILLDNLPHAWIGAVLLGVKRVHRLEEIDTILSVEDALPFRTALE